MSDMQYGKKITTESYYNGDIASVKQEMEVPLFTSKESLLKEVITALSVIGDGTTRKLTLEVCIDSHERYRLTKRWVIS